MPGPLLKSLLSADESAYQAIADTHTPMLDDGLRALSTAANKSLLWAGVAGLTAMVGGSSGRRAALYGIASIGVASATVNLVLKRIADRPRPDREEAEVVADRHVHMPDSTSFPSGHSASAFAFAGGMSHVVPRLRWPLRVAAGLVAYSRVHTGVHYPGDVLVGVSVGIAVGKVVPAVLDRVLPAPGRS